MPDQDSTRQDSPCQQPARQTAGADARLHAGIDSCLDALFARTGPHVVIGTPLGIGKPNALLNRLYARVKADPHRSLHILTALSLQKPQPKPGLEATFTAPILERLFGDYPELDYVDDLRRQRLPANVTVSEFFLKSGDYLKNDTAQQQYMATHYTHAARDMLLQGVNVVAQAVAVRERDGRREYSLSCNPDVTLDLLPLFDAGNNPVFRILVVNRELPFMENDAIIDPARADAIVDCPEGTHTLFCAPNTEVGLADHAIGLHASSLVRDGGTLQIGIGSLGDAICHGLILRDRHNTDYQALLAALGTQRRQDQLGPFRRGLYGCSEMFVNGFMKLMQAGIIRRAVYPHAGLQALLDSGHLDEQVGLDTLDALLAHGSLHRHVEAPDLALLQELGIVRDTVALETDAQTGDWLVFAGHRVPARLDHDATRAALAADGLGTRLRGGHIMTGGFFLGPRDFYQALRDLDDETRARINMTAIGFINQLYGQEALGRAQRRDASFINTCMMVTLLGAAVSDGLDSGRVVSGVGGQYNFVAMSHALPDAQSVLMLRASRRGGDGEVTSNIVWHYGHTTIPRHLRDIVITEYGIADLRGQTDSEVIKRLLAVSDSRFQDDLLAQARANGKIEAGWRIPEHQRRNLPETLAERLRPFRERDLLPDFPFGTDLTPDELGIAKVLRRMQVLQHDKVALAKALWQGRDRQAPAGWLARMGLEQPQGVQQTLMRRLFIACC